MDLRGTARVGTTDLQVPRIGIGTAAPLTLVVARFVKLPGQSEDERHRVLGNRAFVHALRIGQPNPGLREQRLVVLIRAALNDARI